MATAADIGRIPMPIAPGPEMDALLRFHPDITWTGTVVEGGMGPGTPAMTAKGRGEHEVIQDGRWVVGTYSQEQYLLDGTHVLTWQLHWVAGWDPAGAEYRATMADNYGHADVMRGRIDGDRLVFETIGDPPVRLRLVWDLTSPPDLVWRNEMSAGGAPWALVEEYRCTPVVPRPELDGDRGVAAMRVVIVYESLFGNTHEIAEAIGQGIRETTPAAETSCVGVADIGPELLREADLLVVGAPTHMRTMSSGMTRRMGLQSERNAGHGDRIEAGADGPGVRDWLHDLPTATPGSRAAAFDTRADMRMAGGAAAGIARRLRNHGYDLVAEPEHFVIEDSTGPLRDGETDRARAWGAALVRQPAT